MKKETRPAVSTTRRPLPLDRTTEWDMKATARYSVGQTVTITKVGRVKSVLNGVLKVEEASIAKLSPGGELPFETIHTCNFCGREFDDLALATSCYLSHPGRAMLDPHRPGRIYKAWQRRRAADSAKKARRARKTRRAA